MRAVSFDRSALLQTAIVSLLNTLALACLAAVLAYWTWRWMLPAPEPPGRSSQAASGARAGELFGNAAADVVVTAAGIRLLGVVAAADGYPGYAVLQVEGQSIVAAQSGTELAPGLRLVEVHARQVVLERAGVRELLLLPRPPTPLPTSVR
jgi:general secretion pathway protein C